MTTQVLTARKLREPERRIRWDDESDLSLSIETRRGPLRVRHGRFQGGVSDGVEVVEIDTGEIKVTVLPTRGMAVWSIRAGGTRFGWESPVAGPVHPALVPIDDASGIGWLEGFDELLTRCGLESNGAPEFDAHGRVKYPLHGRIGNRPAESLMIEYDEDSGRLDLIGEVCETRLFVKRLRLRSCLRVHAGSAAVELLDDVTNELSTPTAIQLLYHVNVGPPVLGEGASVEAPIKELAPKDALAAGEISRWDQMGPPQRGFVERVYFATLHADDNGESAAMLRSADGNRGFAVRFNTSRLPKFILWKNTAAESDGYVTGLEPATNFPNPHTFEANQLRIVELKPGETASFRLLLHPLTDPQAVESMSQAIREMSGECETEIHREPKHGWSLED